MNPSRGGESQDGGQAAAGPHLGIVHHVLRASGGVAGAVAACDYCRWYGPVRHDHAAAKVDADFHTDVANRLTSDG